MLRDYECEMSRDCFKLAETKCLRVKFNGELSFPCCVCEHNTGTDHDEPCYRCGHNVNATSMANDKVERQGGGSQ